MAQAQPHDDLLFPVAPVTALIRATVAALSGAADGVKPAAEAFAALLGAIQPASVVAPPLQSLPVCRHLPAALAAARGTRAAALAAAAGPLAAEAFWTQNPNYRARPPGPEFLDNYGYFVVAGPADGPPAFVEAPDLAFGLMLLGPGNHYPTHSHPAEEIYIPLAGDAEWQVGKSPWRAEPAGALIHHPSGVTHATRAGAGPLLAVYLWRGQLATRARITNR